MQHTFSIDGKSSLTVKIADNVHVALRKLHDFTQTPAFRVTLAEMWALPPSLRYEFVDLVWLNEEQRRRRGIDVPPGIIIQRSQFSDKRPTLFCISMTLGPHMGWKKVTFTFDNASLKDYKP